MAIETGPTEVTPVAPSVRSKSPDPACMSCRFAKGKDRACILLQKGEQKKLFEDGPCRLPERIQSDTLRLVRRKYPFAARLAEDIGAEVLLGVVQGDNLLVPDRIHHLRTLRLRLNDVIRNGVIDALRRHRLVTRIRCGACVQYGRSDQRPGCRLEYINGEWPRVQANPWFGQKVDASTDPRKLKPPCESFQWRRPETYDLLAEAIPGADANGSSRERAVDLLVKAVDRLAQQDERGMRIAAVLFRHHFRGRSVAQLAEENGVSEKTIKRLLADGRQRLLGIFQRDFGLNEVGELL